MTLGDAVVREAVQLVNQNSDDDRFLRFARSLARDGYVLTWEQEFPIRAALPEEVQLPQADDEVHGYFAEVDHSFRVMSIIRTGRSRSLFGTAVGPVICPATNLLSFRF
jgi:hypothetical protein